MTPSLRPSFDDLQRRKRAVLFGLSAWSEERLCLQPAPASWSALDVLDHLLKVEQGWLDAVRSNLPDGHPVALRDRLGAWAVLCVMRSPMRVKVPDSASQVLPEKAADLSLITQQWQAAREEMAQLLTDLSPKQLRCGLFRHPVSGWMAIRQALAFLSAHLQHHGYQLRRIQRATREF
jgi:uncharacterized damage-inducible protein DinB